MPLSPRKLVLWNSSTNRTADPKQVKRLDKDWLAGERLENHPTYALVVKVASGTTKLLNQNAELGSSYGGYNEPEFLKFKNGKFSQKI